MEDERQDQALGNHMEGLDADEPGCLLGYQWRLRLHYNDVPQNDSASAGPSLGLDVA